MILATTIFVNGVPVGKIREDFLNAVVTFIPVDGNRRLAARKWRDSNACRKAVLNHYRGQSK